MQHNVFTGKLAKAPDLKGSGDSAVCRFTLISNEYAGRDTQTGAAKNRTVTLDFVAFRGKAEAIAKTMKGDQLIVSYRIENNNYMPAGSDEKRYGFNFIVEDFDFGAPGAEKRAAWQAKQEQQG